MKKIKIYIIAYNTPLKTARLYNQITSNFDKNLYDLDVINNGTVNNAPKCPHKQMRRDFGYDYFITKSLAKHKKEGNSYAAYWFFMSDTIIDQKLIDNKFNYVKHVLTEIDKNKNFWFFSSNMHSLKNGIVDHSINFSPSVYSDNIYQQTYMDLTCPIFTADFVNNYPYFEKNSYFLGGFDLDASFYCLKNNKKVGILRNLTMYHEGPSTDFRENTRDIVDEKEARLHIKELELPNIYDEKLSPEKSHKSVDRLRAYGMAVNYGLPYLETVYSICKFILSRFTINKNFNYENFNDRMRLAIFSLNPTEFYNHWAVIWLFEEIKKDFPNKNHRDINYFIGEAYFFAEDYKKCIEYLENSLDEETSYLKIAQRNFYDKYDYLSLSYKNLGNYEDAFENIKERLNYPYGARIWGNFKYFHNKFITKENIQKLTVCETIKKKKICFIIPVGFRTPWDPSMIETGLGGSENVTVYLTEELAKQGHSVTVYANVKTPGIYGSGVTWHHINNYLELDKNNSWDLVILSRNMFSKLYKNYKKIVMWLHDLNMATIINKKNYEMFDAFLPLSQWQAKYFAGLYPYIPKEKIFQFQNGVNLKNFEIDVERNPNKLIYTGCPERGLHTLLKIFTKLHSINPKFELHVFTYVDPKNLNYYNLNQPGVFNRGMVGQQEIAKEFKSSYLWVYPSNWLETFCISAVEAQAAGTPAITNKHGLLPEIVGNSGIVIDEENSKSKIAEKKFIDQILYLTDNKKRWEEYHNNSLKHAKQYSYKITAKKLLSLI